MQCNIARKYRSIPRITRRYLRGTGLAAAKLVYRTNGPCSREFTTVPRLSTTLHLCTYLPVSKESEHTRAPRYYSRNTMQSSDCPRSVSTRKIYLYINILRQSNLPFCGTSFYGVINATVFIKRFELLVKKKYESRRGSTEIHHGLIEL